MGLPPGVKGVQVNGKVCSALEDEDPCGIPEEPWRNCWPYVDCVFFGVIGRNFCKLSNAIYAVGVAKPLYISVETEVSQKTKTSLVIEQGTIEIPTCSC